MLGDFFATGPKYIQVSRAAGRNRFAPGPGPEEARGRRVRLRRRKAHIVVVVVLQCAAYTIYNVMYHICSDVLFRMFEYGDRVKRGPRAQCDTQTTAKSEHRDVCNPLSSNYCCRRGRSAASPVVRRDAGRGTGTENDETEIPCSGKKRSIRTYY